MNAPFTNWLITKVSQWLLKKDTLVHRTYLCDFHQVCNKVQMGDVLLIEGHTRISRIIQQITQSPWSHAVLYIGRLRDIEDPKLQKIVKPYCEGDLEKQLVIESEIGSGTIISSLTNYRKEHIRLLRPQGLTQKDAQKVVAFAIGRLGKQYDVRHILDLARFLFPWGLFPRRWRSSLFQHNALQPTKDMCSSMIAEAFESVDYPILPLIEKGYENELAFIQRNPALFTPTDFDYSPYFDVIKYPFFPLGTQGAYHQLPWMRDEISDDDGTNVILLSPKIQQFFRSAAYAVIGASANRTKFGNKVLRCYLQQKKKVYPVNPNEKTIEGLACINTIADLPSNVKSISIITPPIVTEQIVEQAIKKGIENIWMQPGAESAVAIRECKQHNINVIADGTCILRTFRFRE